MANIHPHIESMLNRYDLNNDDPFEVLREILQEIVLYALYDAGFFKQAVLCRGWQNRPKGRDWYDLVWYVKNGYELDMTHLGTRLKQSCKAFNDEVGDISKEKVLELLDKRMEDLNVTMAKEDVSRFIYDQKELELWSKEFFKSIVSMIKFTEDDK